MKINKETWRKIQKVLKEYHIPYTVHWERRISVKNGEKIIVLDDKYVDINLVVQDFFGDEEEKLPW